MTTAIFFRRDGLITGFEIKGHAGYAQSGADIVCSAISTASHMAVLGLEKVLGIACKTKVDDDRGYLRCFVADVPASQVLLRTLEEELVEIFRKYPEYVRVLYRERRET